MDAVELVEMEDSSDYEHSGECHNCARILINGRDFIDMVREIESPFADREGHPNLAGSYSYFGSNIVFLPSRFYLGEPINEWTDGEGRIYLLSCTCGIPGCWPLTARVEVRAHEIVWSEFRQPHRGPGSNAGEWRYHGLGPFTFDRQRYEGELRKTPTPPRIDLEKKCEIKRLRKFYDLGYRCGGNDRAASGIPYSQTQEPAEIPLPPSEFTETEKKEWRAGYWFGYVVGKSDSELASGSEDGN